MIGLALAFVAGVVAGVGLVVGVIYAIGPEPHPRGARFPPISRR